jgi:very-short-patch-repair endonuclease
MGARGRTVEEMIARLASRSHGVVTRAELFAIGVTNREIARRLENGSLIRVHRAVFRVGHEAPSLWASYLAAVRACGDRALLSGCAAAYLLGVTKGRISPPPEVTAPTERRVRGVRTRRSRNLVPEDGMTWQGIPVTTVARTIVDLAGSLSVDALARACHEAGVLHGTTPSQVEEVLARRPSAPGARKLRLVMWGEVNVTLSKLESRFIELLRDAGLPLPMTNRRVGRRRVDCRWADPPLTVELDGYRYHHSRHAWEQDRRREREARARGDEFRRYTYGDVFEDARYMLDELRRLLRHCPA